MTPEERYQRDPVFHRLVDTLLGQLRTANMTATEIREAAILAAQIHESTCARTFNFPAVAPQLAERQPRCRGCVDPDYTHHYKCPKWTPLWGGPRAGS